MPRHAIRAVHPFTSFEGLAEPWMEKSCYHHHHHRQYRCCCCWYCYCHRCCDCHRRCHCHCCCCRFNAIQLYYTAKPLCRYGTVPCLYAALPIGGYCCGHGCCWCYYDFTTHDHEDNCDSTLTNPASATMATTTAGTSTPTRTATILCQNYISAIVVTRNTWHAS